MEMLQVELRDKLIEAINAKTAMRFAAKDAHGACFDTCPRRFGNEVGETSEHGRGERVARSAGMRNGTLFITVDSSVWLSEIVRYRRQEILDRLRHSFGPQFVKRLSFKLG